MSRWKKIWKSYRGKGIGHHLLEKLIKDSEEHGFWTLQAGIISENNSSRVLHERCGFRMVGYREKLGRMSNGKWHDVVFVERRSKIIGV